MHSTAHFVVDIEKGDASNCIVAQRPLIEGVLSSTGDTDVTGDSKKSRNRLIGDQHPIPKGTMKIRLLAVVAVVWLAISFAVPASMAQDAMKVIKADELVWKEHPVFKGAQTVFLVGDPTKAEVIVQLVKLPPHHKAGR